MTTSIFKEYFKIYTEKQEEYGENTVVLYQNGSFHEIYQRDETYKDSEKIGNAKKIAEILNNMKYSGKSIGQSYINFAGFTSSALDKYLQILLSNNYTVVVVSEIEKSCNVKGNLKRDITAIYSPTLQPIEYNTDYNLLGLSITNSCIYISCINNNTNEIELTECKSLNFDELNRILAGYNPKEIVLLNKNSAYLAKTPLPKKI